MEDLKLHPSRLQEPCGDTTPESNAAIIDEASLDQGDVHANTKILDDGRLDITIDGTANSLKKLFSPVHNVPDGGSSQNLAAPKLHGPLLTLNIVIQVVGSRGDVQPFIALGRTLRKDGHRVRLATHLAFKTFVEQSELDFFSIGGDPAELMAFMVKNPGLLPGVKSLRAGDVAKRRKEMGEIIDGCWRSCVEAGNGTSDENRGEFEADPDPFIADAIIANPPSFAHIHCAEKLQVPLHIMFTMPWSPTQVFPHPLANMVKASMSPSMTNYLSYALVETMTWQGLGDIINKFRVSRLGLDTIDPTFAPGMLSRLCIPHTYAWSPALIPKPHDWGAHLSVAGFYFLPLASTYTAPAELAEFLDHREQPVYIGFGSIVVDNPDELTDLILKAVKDIGVRALISKGWGGLGNKDVRLPDNIFMLGNCPHDWLFPRVSCVVHHGGAGTTAVGIASGKPTVIVPFFGDQPFWGDMVARAGAGPKPIPYKQLTSQRLSSAIVEALQPKVTHRALELGSKINAEGGVDSGASSFYSQLPLERMRCFLLQDRPAVWKVAKSDIHLSAAAAGVLMKENLLSFDMLKLYGPCAHSTGHGATDPLSAGVKVSYGTISGLLSGFSDVSRGMYKSIGDKSSHPSNTLHTAGIASAASDNHSKTHSLTRKGLLKLGVVPFKATADLTTSMAQGLHNTPKLYGDETVRAPDKISGWQSGMIAGGKELGLGVYDGFTGVVSQPIKGHSEEGRAGLYKCVGKGLGGLLFKPLAGVGGLFGFTFKGIQKEIQKRYGPGIEGHLRTAHVAQGFKESSTMPSEQFELLIKRWQKLRADQGN